MRECRLRDALLACAMVAGCTPTSDPEPQPGRVFAPRILGIPSCSYVLVEVSTSPLGTISSSNGSYVLQNSAPVSAGAVKVDGLPPGGALYFRISGLDSDHKTPLWSSSGPVPDGNTPSVTVGGNGFSIVTLEKPTIFEVATAASSGTNAQIQCNQGWPVWTIDGTSPGIDNPGNSTGVNQMSSTQVGVNAGTTLTARCTNGYTWGPSNSWKYNSATMALPDTLLPQIQFQPYPGNSGNLGFRLPTGTSMTRYSNWQVVYQMAGGSKIQVTFTNPSQSTVITGPTTVTAYLVAWDATNSKWVGGVMNSISLPLDLPAAGGPLPAPSISIPYSSGGSVNFTAPSSSSGNYQNWSVMIQSSSQPGTWNQNQMSPMFNFSMPSNSTISAYYLAWDANNCKWVSSPASSASATSSIPPFDPLGPLPKLQVNTPNGSNGYVTFVQPTGSQMSSYTDWKAMVQMNGSGNWDQKSLTESFPYSGGNATLVGYLAAWNPATNSWITGPLDTAAISAYSTTLTAPTFSTNYSSTTLSGTYLVDSSVIWLQIQASNAGGIIYTTDGSDPIPGTTQNWNGAMNNLPFPPEKDTLVVKAMATSGNQISPVATLLVARPAWTHVDLVPVGCLRQMGATKVFACGDSRGPLVWQANSWAKYDGTWTHGSPQTLTAYDTEVLAAVGGQVWRSANAGTFQPVGVALPHGQVNSLARWGDSLWAATNDGIYEWDGNTWNLVPGTPSGTNQLWSGPDALWAGAGNQAWKCTWSGTGRSWIQWTNTTGNVTGFASNPWSTGANSGPLVLSMGALGELDMALRAQTGNAIADALAAHQGLRQVYTWNNRVFAAFNTDNGIGGIAKAGGWTSGWTKVGAGWPSQGSTPSGANGLAVFKNQTAQLIASTPSGTWTIPLP